MSIIMYFIMSYSINGFLSEVPNFLNYQNLFIYQDTNPGD